jgi:predicted Zn-dependent protease
MAAKSRLEQITELLKDDPDDPELRYMLAMEHVSAGNDPEAVRCFEELIRRCPEYAPGFHMAARALLRLNRVQETRAVLQRGIAAATRKNDLHAAGEMQELLASLE